MNNGIAKKVAIGGITAALAVVLMCLGTMIPLATFVCPLLCMILLSMVLRFTDVKIAWSWYVAVCVLGLLLSPDKEAASTFVFLGYYPIIKPYLDRLKLAVLWKMLLFNAAIGAMYATLIWIFGMDTLLAEFAEMGTILCVVTLVLGNICLFIFDYLLTRMRKLR